MRNGWNNGGPAVACSAWLGAVDKEYKGCHTEQQYLRTSPATILTNIRALNDYRGHSGEVCCEPEHVISLMVEAGRGSYLLGHR